MRLWRLSQFVSGAFLLFCAGMACAQQPLAATIGSLLADPKVEGAHWGISVTQMDGTPIYALNDDQLFQPESNNKLFTTAAALALLGPERTWTTRITVFGTRTSPDSIEGGVSLYSNGDAFLSDRTAPYDPKASEMSLTFSKLDALAAQIASSGIKTIHGDVIADSKLPWDPYAEGWNVDDLAWGYGAPITGIALNDNQLRLTVTPGVKPDQPAALRLDPSLPYYTLQNDVRTSSAKSPTNIVVERDGRTLRISGQIAVDTKQDIEKIAVDDPPLYTATVLKSLLEQHGVTVTGTVCANRFYASNASGIRATILKPVDLDMDTITDVALPEPVDPSCAGTYFEDGIVPHVQAQAIHESLPLLDDVILTNKESQNLHAELLLRKLVFLNNSETNQSTFSEGARIVRQFAINAGVQPNDFFLVDGSGMSTDDMVAPRAISQLLRYAATQPWGASYKSSLPIGGVDGTLETRFTKAPLKGNVFAKTGTSSEDRALSGYLVCASGKTVVFSILIGDHLPGSHDDRDVMDKIVAAIAAAN